MKKLLILILVAGCVNAFAQKKVKSGTIYSEHPYIETMRRFAVTYEKQDTAAMGRFFADSAKIYGMTRYAVDTSKAAQWSVPPIVPSLLSTRNTSSMETGPRCVSPTTPAS